MYNLKCQELIIGNGFDSWQDYQNGTELLAQSYRDNNFRKINEVIRYKFATIKS